MILRNARLSDQPRTLERTRMEPERAAEPVAVPARVAAASSETVPAPLAPVIPVSQAEPAPVRPEAKLSFEAVAAWLAVQDRETRAACASMLDEELTQVHEAAKNEGFALGRTKGEKEGRHALDVVHALLGQVVAKAEAAFAEEQARVGEQCVEIVSEAFAKIAGELLATRPAAIGAVLQILGRVKEGRELTIRVCPADLEALRKEEDKLAAALSGRKFSVVADARVEIGGCIVESQLGTLDGRLEVQVRELFETIKAARMAAPEA
jgi:flagellar assembly protein FliH